VAKEREFEGSVTLAFEIRDTGIGLSSEAISLLFGAFQQHDGSDTRSFGGAGMGLAFCRHLVRLMGGQIGVESVEGQGSVFRFSISLLCESQSATSDELLALPNAGPILVVDDNTASRLALVYYLESWHCRAIPASGGKEAAAIFQEALLTANPIALILADHHMPGMDGLRLAEAIGKAPPSRRPRFVLMTLGEFPSQEVLYSAGIDACLPKPVLPRQLKDVLTQVLG
jgi:CheY-like chemotaxis protein